MTTKDVFKDIFSSFTSIYINKLLNVKFIEIIPSIIFFDKIINFLFILEIFLSKYSILGRKNSIYKDFVLPRKFYKSAEGVVNFLGKDGTMLLFYTQVRLLILSSTSLR